MSKLFTKVLGFLKGKKTYLVTVAMFILGGCKAIGIIDDQVYEATMAVLIPLSVAALRASK